MSKYSLSSGCDWCGDRPAKPYDIQKQGTKEKRYAITAMACDKCARRMELGDARD